MIMAQMSEITTKNRTQACIADFTDIEDEKGKETIMRKVIPYPTIEEGLPFIRQKIPCSLG